jgi:glutathione S-transferase
MQRVLYVGTKNASSWSMRAWLALREQDIAFEECLIDIRQPLRAAELARVAVFSPSATVPALVDGDTVIFDSLAIMEYASELGARPLLPKDARTRARARALLAWMHSGLSKLGASLSFESTFYPSAPPAPEVARREAERVIAVWNAELARYEGPYLLGELSLADLTFVPVIRRFEARGIPLDRWPQVRAWSERLMSRPAVLEWIREAEALPPVLLDD